MSDKSFTLEIVTPGRTVFKGSVTSLVAPGALGYLGVLANHAPLTTTLTPGTINWRYVSRAAHILHSTGAGFLQVHHNQVTLLADEIAA